MRCPLGTDQRRSAERAEKRHRLRLLGELLAELDERHGPVDEALIGKYERLLG
jgi:hypothetical protein